MLAKGETKAEAEERKKKMTKVLGDVPVVTYYGEIQSENNYYVCLNHYGDQEKFDSMIDGHKIQEAEAKNRIKEIEERLGEEIDYMIDTNYPEGLLSPITPKREKHSYWMKEFKKMKKMNWERYLSLPIHFLR